MRRSKSKSVTERNKALLEHIKIVKIDHPLWGYRRIWSYLKYREHIPVNKKRIYRLMKEHGLLVTKDARLKAKRGPIRLSPMPNTPITSGASI